VAAAYSHRNGLVHGDDPVPVSMTFLRGERTGDLARFGEDLGLVVGRALSLVLNELGRGEYPAVGIVAPLIVDLLGCEPMSTSRSPSPHRMPRAARSLGVMSEQVPDAACEFAGCPPPSGTAGSTVLRQVIDRLDQVPLGTLRTVNDLSDAAESSPDRAAQQIPPIPDAFIDAVAFIDVLLSRLPPPDLRAVAQQLAVDRATAMRGALLALAERTAEHEWPIQAGHTPRRGRERALLTALVDHECAQWTPVEIATLRRALRLHLARIGDAFLRVSEGQPPRLRWQRRDHGVLTTQRPVPGAPQPLEAHISDEDSRLAEDAALALFGATRARPSLLHRWDVGWRDAGGTFGSHSGQTEASIQAAQFAAEATIDGLAATPARVRMPFTGLLLVPRSTNTRNIDGHVVDLEQMLIATLNQHRDEQHYPDPTVWSMRPHRTADTDLASIVAALFDHLGLPWPTLHEPACAAEVDSAEFTTFLTAQAITLTPLARCYLAGLGDAGPGERTLAQRHAAAMRAVLRDQDPEATPLALELPTRHISDYPALVDITALEAFFAAR
jgi:hypothetical protein